MTLSRTDTAAARNHIQRGDNGMLERFLREGGAAKESILVTTATLAASPTTHEGAVVLLARAAGVTVTLPAATGTQNEYTFVVSVAVTSNADIIKVANATDVFVGVVSIATATFAAGSVEAAQGTDDTLSMNGTTTGGLIGSIVKVKDIATGVWLIDGRLTASGAVATSLSATV